MGGAERRALFGLLFFLSGAAGLVYELLWVRELQHFFGSTIHSITTVVAAYMGGLGLGAWVMGRRADRHPNPAHLYGALELAIGIFGIASALIFRGVGAAYLGLARVVEPGLWVATAAKFVFAFAVMLVPTFLMGATLPVLTRAFTGAETGRLRRELALFYGLNTVGGVAGCLLAGFVLVEYVGIARSLVLTGVLNLGLGAAAIALSRRAPAPAPGEGEAAVPAGAGAPAAALAGAKSAEHQERDAALAPALRGDAHPPEDEADLRRLARWVIGLTAFASLLYEIAWTRVLVLVVGSSTYAFTTILACFLFGIGLGSLIGIGRGRPRRELLRTAAIVQGAIAVLAALLFPFFRLLPTYIVATLQIPFLTATEIVVLQSLVLAVVITPPAVGMGLVFPLLADAAASRTAGAGRETGRAYFANTAGSILGSVVTGFILVHTLGAERTLVLGVAINVALAAWITWRLQEARGGWQIPEGERVGILLGALALVIALLTPSWSTRLLDRGPAIYGRDRMDRERLDHFLRGYGAEQLMFDEGWNATVSVWRNGGTTWLKTNGKADASSVADMDTQVLVGLLPALAHPRPARVFMVGLGSGVTARVVGDVQGVERIDVVEIEHAVVQAARYFQDVNGDVLADPRVRLVEDDARSALQLAEAPYDVIVSEPSNPWISGIAALYTRDYFRIARSRLAEDGVFAQWVQMYRVPISVVAVVVANLRAVFPYVEVWYANPSDLVLLAANGPIRWSSERVAAHFDPATPAGRALRDWVRVAQPTQLLGRFLLGENGTSALAQQAAFTHTDNRPALEFVAARSLLATSASSEVFDSLVGLKNMTGDSLPLLDGGWRLAPGEWEAAYARSLPATNRFALALAQRAVEADPRDPERHVLLGRVLFDRDRYRAALASFREALRLDPSHGDALVLGGQAAATVAEFEESRTLLERGLAAGGDTVLALSALAETAVGQGDYERAADLARRAVRAVRPTLRAPFPAALQSAVRRLAWEAPPPLAARVLAAARESRPSWDLGYHGGAVALVRWGPEYCGEAQSVAAELPRFGWTAREIIRLLGGCARL